MAALLHSEGRKAYVHQDILFIFRSSGKSISSRMDLLYILHRLQIPIKPVDDSLQTGVSCFLLFRFKIETGIRFLRRRRHGGQIGIRRFMRFDESGKILELSSVDTATLGLVPFSPLFGFSDRVQAGCYNEAAFDEGLCQFFVLF